MPVAWKDAYRVGINAIDEQHKSLFDIVNRLEGASQGRHDRQVLVLTMQAMSDYIAVHFATEEKYMEQFGYPGLKEHRAQHESCSNKMVTFMIAVNQERPLVGTNMVAFLKDWVTRHILDVDQQMTPFFKAKGIS